MSSSIIMCISKILTDLCSIKQKIRVKNIFVRKLREHKEDYLMINGKQSVKLESGYISFKNYFKQIPVPFKIYPDFGCIFKKVDCDIEHNYTSSYRKKYQNHVPRSFTYKAACIDNKYSKKKNLYRGKDAVNKIIKSILKEYNYCRSVGKKHFNKKLDYGCRRKLKI